MSKITFDMATATASPVLFALRASEIAGAYAGAPVVGTVADAYAVINPLLSAAGVAPLLCGEEFGTAVAKLNIANDTADMVYRIATTADPTALVIDAELMKASTDGTGDAPAFGVGAGSVVNHAGALVASQATLGHRPIRARRPKTGVRNLLIRTTEFNLSAWTKTDAVVTANAAAAPDGTMTADRLETTVATNPNVQQALSSWAADVAYTASVWLKGGNTTSAFLQLFRNGGGGVTHTNAQIIEGPGSVSGIGSTEITVTGLSLSEWTRISITATPPAGGNLAFYIKNRISGATVGDFNFIWNAQVEVGSTATADQIVGANGLDVTEAGVRSVTDFAFDGIAQRMALASAFSPAGDFGLIAAHNSTSSAILGGPGIRFFRGSLQLNSSGNRTDWPTTPTGAEVLAVNSIGAGAAVVWGNGAARSTTLFGAMRPLNSFPFSTFGSDTSNFTLGRVSALVGLRTGAMTTATREALQRVLAARTGVTLA